MEVHAFNTQDVEEKLYEILHALKALDLAAGGLRNDELICDKELCAFEYIVQNAARTCGDLLEGLHPVWFQDSGKIVLLFGEEE